MKLKNDLNYCGSLVYRTTAGRSQGRFWRTSMDGLLLAPESLQIQVSKTKYLSLLVTRKTHPFATLYALFQQHNFAFHASESKRS